MVEENINCHVFTKINIIKFHSRMVNYSDVRLEAFCIYPKKVVFIHYWKNFDDAVSTIKSAS